MLPRNRFEEVVNSLERFYKVDMDKFSRDAFYDYANSTFSVIAKFDRAATLVMANEPNYGRFPAFTKFGEAFSGYMRSQTESQQAAAVHLLPVAQSRNEEVNPWNLPVTKSDIERLKAKVYVCQFFRSQKTITWSSRYLKEAIEEATAREISMSQIGVTEIDLDLFNLAA